MLGRTSNCSKIYIYIPSEEDDEEEVVCAAPQNTAEEEKIGAKEESTDTDGAGWTLWYTDM